MGTLGAKVPMNMQPLLIRADAGPDIGTGHVMRCLALAQQWRAEGGEVTFLSRCEVPALRQRILDEGFAFVSTQDAHPHPSDLARTLDEARKAAWVALDGYHFAPSYQKALREAGCRTLVLDDTNHWPEYHADILLNQNIGAEKTEYACDTGVTQLKGLRFALLRREFLEQAGNVRTIPARARRVLVSLGGAAPVEATRRVLEGLLALDQPELEVVTVCGMAGAMPGELQHLLGAVPFNAKLLGAAQNMPELMAWADVAIVSAGSTCWETACFGLPTILGILADNQSPNACRLHRSGLAVSLGWWHECAPAAIANSLRAIFADEEKRRELSSAAKKQVDGQGAKRIVELMRILSGGACHMEGNLREAGAEDCEGIWRIANDPSVRAHAFSPQTILWDSHCRWYADKLASEDSRLFVLNLGGLVAGFIRYDRAAGDTATISFAVAPAFRKRGVGSGMIRATWQEAARALRVRRVNAYGKEDNAASHACFQKAGFTLRGWTLIQGQGALEFERTFSETAQGGR